MNSLVRIIVCFVFLLMNIEIASANQDGVVHLQYDEIRTLKAPVHTYQSSYDIDSIEDSCYFEAEDEIFESKAGKAFSKVVDKVIINNKINNFSSKMGY